MCERFGIQNPDEFARFREEVWHAMTTDAHPWHPWLRINRVLRVMLHER